MKIIHTADLHLDSKMTAHLPPDKARQRRKELLSAFQKMLDYACQNQVQAILIAGDLFDTRNVSALARNTVYEAITANPQIDFYYLRGNHDVDSFLSGIEEIPTNLKLFGGEWIYYERETQAEHKIVIAGIELDSENVTTIYDSLRLNRENFNIVILHGQEAESIGKQQAENINIKGLKNKGIDYLALGHIHRYKKEKLDGRGIYCYCGCLEARGFDEVGEHGFVLLDIDEKTGRYEHHFIPQAERVFYERELNIGECRTTAQIAERIKGFLAQEQISAGDMLKLVLVGEMDVESEKDMEMLNHQFKNSFYFCKIYDQTKWKVEESLYRNEKSLRGEFVRAVQNNDLLSEAEKAEMIQYGIMVLRGEKIE